MKVHVVTDSSSGLVHSGGVTAGSVHTAAGAVPVHVDGVKDENEARLVGKTPASGKEW